MGTVKGWRKSEFLPFCLGNASNATTSVGLGTVCNCNTNCDTVQLPLPICRLLSSSGCKPLREHRRYEVFLSPISQNLMLLWLNSVHGHSLEKEIATHSVILAWEIPWTEEPGGL